MSVRRQIRKVSVEKVSLVFKFMGEGEYLPTGDPLASLLKNANLTVSASMTICEYDTLRLNDR